MRIVRDLGKYIQLLSVGNLLATAILENVFRVSAIDTTDLKITLTTITGKARQGDDYVMWLNKVNGTKQGSPTYREKIGEREEKRTEKIRKIQQEIDETRKRQRREEVEDRWGA